jgi:hypothetical protein
VDQVGLLLVYRAYSFGDKSGDKVGFVLVYCVQSLEIRLPLLLVRGAEYLEIVFPGVSAALGSDVN